MMGYQIIGVYLDELGFFTQVYVDDKIYRERITAENRVAELLREDRRLKAYRIKEVTILPTE